MKLTVKVVAAALMIACLGASAASAQHARTPRPGSLERKQILDALRPAPESGIRFVVHSLRVVKGKGATFAYAAIEPSRQEYDGGEYILQRGDADGAGQWRKIWAITGGGANSCADIARYYEAVTQHLKQYGIAADTLNPGHTSEAKRQAAAAAAEDDCWSVGDLGPDLRDAPD